MILSDVNVLVYAFREDMPDHRQYLKWLTSLIDGDFGRFSGLRWRHPLR